jgi:hypothetical protein
MDDCWNIIVRCFMDLSNDEWMEETAENTHFRQIQSSYQCKLYWIITTLDSVLLDTLLMYPSCLDGISDIIPFLWHLLTLSPSSQPVEF